MISVSRSSKTILVAIERLSDECSKTKTKVTTHELLLPITKDADNLLN